MVGKVVIPCREIPSGAKHSTRVELLSDNGGLSVPRSYEELVAGQLISAYESRGYRYVPLPDANRYYSIPEDELYDLDPEMVVPDYANVFEAIELLAEHPFVVIDYQGSWKYNVLDEENYDGTLPKDEDSYESLSPDDFYERYPDLAESFERSEDRYGLVTLSGVNRKPFQNTLSPYVTQLTEHLATAIKAEYPDSESLFEHLPADTVGAYEKTRNSEAAVHVAEFMDLPEMRAVVLTSYGLVEECGFGSKEACEETFDAIQELRDRVVRTDRALVRSSDDLADLLSQFDRLVTVLERLTDFEDPREAASDPDFETYFYLPEQEGTSVEPGMTPKTGSSRAD